MTLRVRFHPLVDPPADLEPFPVSTAVELLRSEGLRAGSVECVLSDDTELSRLNETFRGRSGPTDVLAFPYARQEGGDTVGDVFVSIDRAREQARERGEPVAREVWRLFVHGLLHLAGYRHDDDEHEVRMLAVQERWVAEERF